jgi:hypothetical protein
MFARLLWRSVWGYKKTATHCGSAIPISPVTVFASDKHAKIALPQLLICACLTRADRNAASVEEGLSNDVTGKSMGQVSLWRDTRPTR